MEGIKDLALASATKRLRSILCDLSAQLCVKTQSEPSLAGMGATAVLALFRRNKTLIAHMGDSRAYLFRRGRLKLLTKDHTIVQFLLDAGEITLSQAHTHPARNRLTRFVGMPRDPLPDLQPLELREDDRLLLCSDGSTSMTSDETIDLILKRKVNIQTTCTELVAAANKAGGRDDITTLVVQWYAHSRARKDNYSTRRGRAKDYG